MSIFTRPDSPPPRQPSPQFIPTPLPSPHIHARLRKSSSKQSLPPTTTPPGLHSFPTTNRLVHPVRSYDHLVTRRSPASTSSHLTPSPPRSLQIHSAPLAADIRPHRRCISHSTPYRSPPPSPTMASLPPPVPPIPAFVLEGKPSHTSQRASVTPIHLDSISPLSESVFLPRKQARRPRPTTPEKHSCVGMTCWKFFSLRSMKQRITCRTNI